MKSTPGVAEQLLAESLPARGEWIEIISNLAIYAAHVCRSPHGERGLKYTYLCDDGHIYRRVAPRTGSVD